MKTDMTSNNTKKEISRRRFLAIGTAAAASAIIPSLASGAVEDHLAPERTLSFYSLQTDERLKTVYWQDGRYIPDALAEIDFIMRDHRTGDVKEIDTRLLDLLHSIYGKMGTRHPFHITSGYRSPATNAMLKKKGRGVGINSLHIYGMAADITVPGRSLESLRYVATKMRSGGVGFYPRSNFVHVDVGDIRYW
jgi:uncharacterized protein YcbK (DUF882 family)